MYRYFKIFCLVKGADRMEKVKGERIFAASSLVNLGSRGEGAEYLLLGISISLLGSITLSSAGSSLRDNLNAKVLWQLELRDEEDRSLGLS